MSKMWTLIREAYLPEGVLGELRIADGPTLYTIERPWLNNKPFVSCIPEGEYALEWDTTGRIKQVPRLRDVPDRTQINIHVANYASELHGCLGVGLDWSVEDQLPRVVKSKKAMALLLEHVDIGDRDYIDGMDLDIELRIKSARAI